MTAGNAAATVWRDMTGQNFAGHQAVSLQLPGNAPTGFVAVDKTGGAAACILGRNGLFGGAANATPTEATASALLVSEDGIFYAAFVGTGDAAADVASRVLAPEHPPLERVLAERQDRVNLVNGIVCPGGLPAEVANCQTRADPHGYGLAGIALGR